MISRASALLAAFLLCSCGAGTRAAVSAAAQITVQSPAQGATVSPETVVRCKIKNWDGQGYPTAIVHPLATKLYYVQRPPSPPARDGSFQMLCYFGTKTEGAHETYELFVLLLERPLEEDTTLKTLPKGVSMTDAITVTRGD
jgi:hypothetical protein